MHKKTKQRQITHNRARHIKDQCQGIANEGCLQKASRLSISQLMIELGWIPMGDERIAGGSLEAQPFLVKKMFGTFSTLRRTFNHGVCSVYEISAKFRPLEHYPRYHKINKYRKNLPWLIKRSLRPISPTKEVQSVVLWIVFVSPGLWWTMGTIRFLPVFAWGILMISPNDSYHGG